MKIKNIFAALMALVPLAAAAQNLNPTVEVSKAYEGKLIEVDKPQLNMAVPDTVYKFNLDFDYSVTQTPYKGSYEFRPYTVDMAPAPVVRETNTLYLKAGVGYQLHPVLDFVWSPVFKKPLKLNVYASHDSFFGNYWKMNLIPSEGTFSMIDRVGKDYSGKRSWQGYDFNSKVGAEGRYDWEKYVVKFAVGAQAVQQKDFMDANRSLFGVDVKAGFASKLSDSPFMYRADVAYRFGNDLLNLPLDSKAKVVENDFDLDAGFMYTFENEHRGKVDLNIEYVGTSGEIASSGVDVDIVPHYAFDVDRWRFDLGLRYSTSVSTHYVSDTYKYRGQLFYPHMRIEYMMIPDAMKLYLNLLGDSGVTSYSDLRRFNPRADMNYGRGTWNILDVSEEHVNASLGIEGRAGNRFSYDFKVGIASLGNVLVDGVVKVDDMLLPALGYSSYDKFYSTLGWMWDMDCVRFDGLVDFTYSFNSDRKYMQGFLFPPMLKGDVSITYNWKKRIFAGVDCQFATSRGGSVLVPGSAEADYVVSRTAGYADLGLNAEYAVTRKLSVWLRGGNLLGMTIQRSILYAEKGPYFTAGIYFNM